MQSSSFSLLNNSRHDIESQREPTEQPVVHNSLIDTVMSTATAMSECFFPPSTALTSNIDINNSAVIDNLLLQLDKKLRTFSGVSSEIGTYSKVFFSIWVLATHLTANKLYLIGILFMPLMVQKQALYKKIIALKTGDDSTPSENIAHNILLFCSMVAFFSLITDHSISLGSRLFLSVGIFIFCAERTSQEKMLTEARVLTQLFRHAQSREVNAEVATTPQIQPQSTS